MNGESTESSSVTPIQQRIEDKLRANLKIEYFVSLVLGIH